MNNNQNNNYGNSNNYNNYNDYNNQNYQNNNYNNQGYINQQYNNYNSQNNYQNSNYDNNQGNNQSNNQKANDLSCLSPISNLKTIDPSFNEEDFKYFAQNVYEKLQKAWTNDLRRNTWNNEIRQYMTDDLYNFYLKQLQRLKRKNQENVVDKVKIFAHIQGYKELANYDMIVVRYSGTLIDYVIDLNTGKLMIGKKTEPIIINETFIFIRTKNMRNPEMMKTYNCVYCGAGLNQSSNRCEYCGGINVVDNSPNWVLCKAVKGENYKYQGGMF